MDTFLTGLKSAVDTLGPTVLLPIVIFIIALVLGAKAGRAFRAAVTIGVAFIGINLVLGLMLGSIGDVAKAIVTNTGIHRDIVDVGWPSAAAIAFGSSSSGVTKVVFQRVRNPAMAITATISTIAASDQCRCSARK